MKITGPQYSTLRNLIISHLEYYRLESYPPEPNDCVWKLKSNNVKKAEKSFMEEWLNE